MNLMIYVLINTLPAWWAIYSCRKLKGTKELNDKYYAFCRDDYHHWSYWKLPLCNILLLWPLRFGTAWLMVLLFTTFILINMCGKPIGTKLPLW